MKKQKRILEMNDEEIHSLARIILPGIKTNSMTRSDLQEEIINW